MGRTEWEGGVWGELGKVTYILYVTGALVRILGLGGKAGRDNERERERERDGEGEKGGGH